MERMGTKGIHNLYSQYQPTYQSSALSFLCQLTSNLVTKQNYPSLTLVELIYPSPSYSLAVASLLYAHFKTIRGRLVVG